MTRNSNKPVEPKSHTQKPGRQIFTGHRFSPNNTSDVYEKTSPRSYLRWIPTGKIFASYTSKADSEPTHGSNVNISNIQECKLTLDLSADTSINVQKEQSFDLSAGTSYNVNKDNLRVWLLKNPISQKRVPRTKMSNNDVCIKWFKPRTTTSTKVPTSDMIVMTSMIELESLLSPLFDEYFNEENQVVTKSSAVTTADASDKRQQQPDSTSSTSTLPTTISTDGNFDL
ncbi:hypothetical protein Tco_0201387 [Tanacetum coccineum]